MLSALLSFLPFFAAGALLLTGLMHWSYDHRLFDIGLRWWAWPLGLLVYDLVNWTQHYLSHKTRIGWAMHSVHHSAREMKASVAFRGSWADVFWSAHILTWLPLLGFHSLMLIVLDGIVMS